MQPEETPTDINRHKTLVCVIEDDDLVRRTIATMLQDAGFDVIEASDGSEGIKQVERRYPQLVITDIIMPNKDGIETILELRRRFPMTRIVAISGGGRRSPHDFLSLAKWSGADTCVSKPFRAGDILKAAADALAAERPPPPPATDRRVVEQRAELRAP